MVIVRHPSLWVFLCSLKTEERRTAKTVREIRRGQHTDNRRRKWRTLEERINKLKGRFANGTITLKQYWDAIRHAVH
jgi:hypothetical protein